MLAHTFAGSSLRSVLGLEDERAVSSRATGSGGGASVRCIADQSTEPEAAGLSSH